jgi:hypothetical protein
MGKPHVWPKTYAYRYLREFVGIEGREDSVHYNC